RSLMGQSNVKFDFTEIEKQRLTQFESELAAADLAAARDHALEISRRHDRVSWETVAGITIIAAVGFAAMKFKRKELLPLNVLISAGICYRNDSVDEKQLDTVNKNAERLLKESPHLFARPGGPITVTEIDRLRSQMYGSA
ncbi:hypothetical protein PENTCL1PPCAC_5428, partial [Pristionchus entomophagus]